MLSIIYLTDTIGVNKTSSLLRFTHSVASNLLLPICIRIQTFSTMEQRKLKKKNTILCHKYFLPVVTIALKIKTMKILFMVMEVMVMVQVRRPIFE